MRAPRRDWSDTESATLAQMWLAGQTAVAIGIALGGRGSVAIYSEAKRQGLPRRSAGFVLDAARERTWARRRGQGDTPAAQKARGVAHRQAKGRRELLDAFPPVRFVDATSKQCRFIEGEPAGADTLMCGRPIEAGSYCKGHRAICVMPEVADGR